jgi:phage regulator Rha-like protein
MTRSLSAALDDRILTLRGVRVLLDADLAVLYGVSTKVFNQAVKRNVRRFPKDFRFQLTAKEVADLRSQSVTSSGGESHGGRRYLPWAFTQEGVAMLSGVLGSARAVAANIAIMRAFVRMRRALAERGDVLARLEALEDEVRSSNATTEKNLRVVFETLRRLLDDESTTTPGRIGFRLHERGPAYRADARRKETR